MALASAGVARGVGTVPLKMALVVALVALKRRALTRNVTRSIAAVADSVVFTVGGMMTGLQTQIAKLLVVGVSLLEFASRNSVALLPAEEALYIYLTFGAVSRHVAKGTTIMALELGASLRPVSRLGAQATSDIGILPWPLRCGIFILGGAHVSDVTGVSTVTAHNGGTFADPVARLATMEALHRFQ